jgi:hypothetical protein
MLQESKHVGTISKMLLVVKHSVMFLMFFLSFMPNYLERNKLCILVKFTVASNSPSDLAY